MAVKDLPDGSPFLCGEPSSISLLESAERAGKEWKLADFQRGVVWDWKQKKSLLESLYLGIPVGSLYIWDVKDKPTNEIQSRELVGISKPEAKTTGLIIDGQQRLTFLSKFKQSFEDLDGYKRSNNPDAIIVINLAKSEESTIPIFERYVLTKSQKEELAAIVDAPMNGVSIEKAKQDRIFEFLLNNEDKEGNPEELLWTQYLLSRFKGKDSDEVTKFLQQNDVENNHIDISKRFFRAINERQFGLHMINNIAERNDCVHIYERVNKSGRRLDDMDYVEAMLTCHCPGFYKRLNEFEENIQSSDFKGGDKNFREIKRKVILSAVLYDLYGTTSRKKAMENGLQVYQTIVPGSSGTSESNAKKINESLTRVKTAFQLFRELLGTHLGFKNSAGFKEKPQVVAVTWLIKNKEIKDADARKMLAWFIHANTFNHYSGQGTDDKADADCNLASKNLTPWVGLRKNIARHMGAGFSLANIKITEKFYEHNDYITKRKDIAIGNRSFQNSLNWTMVKHNAANDWISGASLTETLEVDIHHIHPKSRLKGKPNRIKDHIANKCFISKHTNRKVIKDKKPSEYIQKIQRIDKNRLTAHQIPIEDQPIKYDNIEEFIKKRVALLCREANRIIDRLKEGKDPKAAEIKKLDITSEISKKEGEKIERKLRFFTQEKCGILGCKNHSIRDSNLCYQHRESDQISGEQGLVETKPIKSSMVRESVAFLNSKGGSLFVGVRDKPDQEDPTPGLGEEMDYLYPNETEPDEKDEKYLQKVQDYVREGIDPKSAYDNNVEVKLLKQNKATGKWLEPEEIHDLEQEENNSLDVGNTVLWVNVGCSLEASFEGVRQKKYEKFDKKSNVKKEENKRWIRKGEQVYDADDQSPTE